MLRFAQGAIYGCSHLHTPYFPNIRFGCGRVLKRTDTRQRLPHARVERTVNFRQLERHYYDHTSHHGRCRRARDAHRHGWRTNPESSGEHPVSEGERGDDEGRTTRVDQESPGLDADRRAGDGPPSWTSGAGRPSPNELVRCDHVEIKLDGSSRKFPCAIRGGDIVKVRYGATNGEVEGAVLASRLLWALGFGADRVYPVRVLCRGCSPDPWTKQKNVQGEQMFDPAAIELSHEGHQIKSDKNPGWAWPELALIDETQGGAPRAQRDALTLLAVFMQHTDSKPVQQRLLCLPRAARPPTVDATNRFCSCTTSV